MTIGRQFEEWMDQLMDCAIEDYTKTAEYVHWKEKLDEMETECNDMFIGVERAFAFECFSLLLETSESEEVYIYRRGFTDCIALLKTMGVLS